jgi:glutathione S-transferase
MAANIKPLVLYGAALFPPNPFKVHTILKELDLPYESKDVLFDAVKKPEYTALNPNGRLPTLYDPNTDITLWESGAIIQYIIDKYDKDHKLSFPAGTKEAYLLNQWLHFQMSGQGPYYGQAAWFKRYHPEQIPSAIERYEKEIQRVTKVLDTHLEGKEYLVGNKCTYADLAFVAWQSNGPWLWGDYDVEKAAPNAAAWMARLSSRPAVAALLEQKWKEMPK